MDGLSEDDGVGGGFVQVWFEGIWSKGRKVSSWEVRVCVAGSGCGFSKEGKSYLLEL